MKREEGYYWCKINSEWEICYYNTDEQAFERTMDDSYTYESEFEEIDENKLTRINQVTDFMYDISDSFTEILIMLCYDGKDHTDKKN